MIVFDLKCAGGHVFEAWFGSSGDFEAQQARGLVACPLCGADRVETAVMAPAVAAKGNRATLPGDSVATGGGGAPSLAKLLAMQRAMEAQSEWVGERFAAEARAMHEAGEVRAVHGEATLAEAKALAADGVPVMPLPFTPLAKSDA
jgi:hypothetical protein